MKYETYPPHSDLAALVKCHWILEVPGDFESPKQRVVPDGCIEMFFILGDDVKRYTSEEEYIIQPRAMVYGQIKEPYIIQPTGYVDTFAVRFYPYGFASFTETPIQDLADRETLLTDLFDEKSARDLEKAIINATSTQARIKTIEEFLLKQLVNPATIDRILKSTIDALWETGGSVPIQNILGEESSKRRSLERQFSKQVGISPKQLGKIIRLQAALKTLLTDQEKSLTQIAYESEYYDQAHFIKDFKEFTGINPKSYLGDDQMMLSSLIYRKE